MVVDIDFMVWFDSTLTVVSSVEIYLMKKVFILLILKRKN